MEKLPNGLVTVVNLPGSGSILHRAWHLYEKHLAQFCIFSLLLGVGVLVNAGLGALLTIITPAGDVGHGLTAFGITAINFLSAFYLVFIFCGFLVFLNQLRLGELLTISQALEQGRAHVKSVFWISLGLAMLLYGSVFTGVLFVVFSFWYYFALYVSIVDGVKGTTAFAKSRYLTHGLFFKIAGRYLTIISILFVLYFLAYATLGIPVVGVAVFLLLTVAVTFFAIPFFLIYDFIRFIDIAAVQRTVEFSEFRGERVGIITWMIIGLVLFGSTWTLNLFTDETQTLLLQNGSRNAARIILPYAKEMQANLNTILNLLGKDPNTTKLKSPDPAPTAEELKSLLDLTAPIPSDDAGN
ncbi:MAG: hypothetical protein Q7S47_01120 [bacterium]|nr:hypothetical protein [bacterium]